VSVTRPCTTVPAWAIRTRFVIAIRIGVPAGTLSSICCGLAGFSAGLPAATGVEGRCRSFGCSCGVRSFPLVCACSAIEQSRNNLRATAKQREFKLRDLISGGREACLLISIHFFEGMLWRLRGSSLCFTAATTDDWIFSRKRAPWGRPSSKTKSDRAVLVETTI
jgi:hypothetical protein